jgi:hypothetical protein
MAVAETARNQREIEAPDQAPLPALYHPDCSRANLT